jgi:hypothetical protein
MAAKVRRLRPKRHDRIAEALQLVLELPLELEPPARTALNNALSSYAPAPWPFIMLNRIEARRIQQRIQAGKRPGITLAVWLAVLSYTAYGTGEIEASREELAKQAGTTERSVSRALVQLARIGALQAVGRGRYEIHPSVAWHGPLASREAAARKLTPVE